MGRSRPKRRITMRHESWRSPRPERVLFTTACAPRPYDYIATNTPLEETPRLRYERHISYGLRFLEANLPAVRILEYPRWSDYLQVLDLEWDAVGFSFYTNETPIIRDMARAAREAGVPELWGGNYGVLTPEAVPLFDRVATGYAEHEVASWLGVDPEPIDHPTLVVPLKLGSQLGLVPLGILFTVRGCNRGCTFCQTPVFCGHRLVPLPLSGLARVIEEYRRLRVGAVLILDECFGAIPAHAEEVVSLLDRASLPWLPMTRADILDSRLAAWGPRGLAGCLLGIESLEDGRLRHIRKGGNATRTTDLIRRLHAGDRLVVGYCMIGFENDDRDSLRAAMQDVADLKLDVTQVCILTPFHGTKLWEELSEHGIRDEDLSKFDGKHLVWNHPNFEPSELEGILQEFFATTFPPDRDAATMRRFARQLMRRVGMGAGLTFLAGTLLQANAMAEGR